MLRDLPCAYHQGLSITNFCDDQQCLMPLCPKCLPIHIQEHKKNKTYGSLQPIDDVIEKVNLLVKQKIDTYKKLSSNNQKTTQNNSDLNRILTRKIKQNNQIHFYYLIFIYNEIMTTKPFNNFQNIKREAKDRIQFEIDTYFNALENKCQKMCQELSMKQMSSLKNESLNLEKKIRQQEEYLEGLFKKDKCLMSLICALKDEKEDVENGLESTPCFNNLNQKNDGLDASGILLKKIELKVDLEKLTKITDSLSGYAKIIYNQTKKQVTFDNHSMSNKSVSSSADSRSSPEAKPNKNNIFQSPTQEKKKKESKKQGNDIYQKEEIEENSDKEEESEINKNEDEELQSNKQVNKRDSDDVYLLNDPEIIKIRQRREERRLRAELREIGKFNPMSQQNITNNKEKNKSKIDDKKKVEEIKEPSSSNFITYQRPAKDELKQFAKPQELEFLDMVQKKSQQMQTEFEKQQNEIYVTALSYQIPTAHQRVYQPKNFGDQQQSNPEISSPLMSTLKNQNFSQPKTDFYQTQQSQNLQQQHLAQQQYSQRLPQADMYQQNNFRQLSPQYTNQYETQSYAPSSQSIQQFGSPNRSVNNSFRHDQLNNSNSIQNLQQWQNRY